MFTGIVERTGVVREIGPQRVVIEAKAAEGDPWQIGESVSVNGCCLTLVASDPHLVFELSEETLARTSLSALASGAKVNLERAMKAGDRFGGHIVQGHVDVTGHLLEVQTTDQAHVMRFEFPKSYNLYIIEKGSITVDGVSLTVVDPTDDEFSVWIIPHTWQETNLSDMEIDSPVNLEFDVLAKYVERLLTNSSGKLCDKGD
jgi:riboflavin synthase